MGKRGVGRPRTQVVAHRKGVERTIITQAIIEPTMGENDQQGITNDTITNATTTTNEDEAEKQSEEPAQVTNNADTIRSKAPLKALTETLSKPWVELIKGNRNLNRGMAVEFVAPEIINRELEIQIDDSDVEDELEFWQNAMILFALGDSLSMNGVKKFMKNSWSFVMMPNFIIMMKVSS
ncbi:unnamed protein product [Lathyrus sativus]|nr:unnamed protein product [Lathyrus sativus]